MNPITMLMATLMSLFDNTKGYLTKFKEDESGQGEVVMSVIVILVMVAVYTGHITDSI